MVAGLGAGLAGAAATAAASGAPDPERLFAVASVVGGVAGSFAVLPLGSAIAAAGADGMFLFMVVATAVVAPLLRGLPAPASAAAGAAPRIRRAGAASLVLAGFFLFALGQNAVWAFTERIAKDLGIDVETMAMILAVTNLLGLAGAGGAALLGLRVGRRVPLLGSVAVTMVATAFLVEARGIGGFVAANLFWALGFFFAMPYFLGTLATLDDRGRWAAIGTGLASVGAALGPAAAGLVLAEQGYGPLLGLVLACGGVAVALLAPVLTRLDKESALLAAGEA
ncbi:MAG: hypothetical protein CL910_17630 [Deltaproteobacteria bacterium]|nr:hypothetical protein [Deltaproteobacteria bacterium]